MTAELIWDLFWATTRLFGSAFGIYCTLYWWRWHEEVDRLKARRRRLETWPDIGDEC